MPAALDPACAELIAESPRVAVAVSGGADSLALLSLIADAHQIVFAYTVDHDLRAGSEDEARHVGSICARWPHVTHRILKWTGDKPATGLQDAARVARYALLMQACLEDATPVLCLAHHRDDQAETVLHRLAKGSGLDGLCAMRPVAERDALLLLRPLLNETHEVLKAHCTNRAIAWVEDPSNQNDKFARVRLRQTRAALEAEGLTNDRLSRLADRMARARDALDHYADQEWRVWLKEEKADRIVLLPDALSLPHEIVLRLTLKAAGQMGQAEALRANMKRLEDHLDTSLSGNARGARLSLGGLLITYNRDKGMIVERESA